jgi:hypothetical protein
MAKAKAERQTTVNHERQMKTHIFVDTLGVYDFDGSFENVIKFLIEKKEAWEKHGYTNLKIEASHNYDDVTIDIVGDRWELDEEVEERIAIEKGVFKTASKKKKEKDAAEKALYQRLKKKYEKK